MPVRVYDPRRVAAVFDDVIIQGLGPDAGIESAPVEEEDQADYGIDGEVLISMSSVTAQIVTITLMPNVPAHKQLAALRKEQEAGTRTTSQFTLEDPLNGDSLSEQGAWILNRPGISKGKKGVPFAWKILCPNPTIVIADNAE